MTVSLMGFIHSFDKYLLSACSVPGSVLCAGDIVMNTAPALMTLTVYDMASSS